MSACNVDCRVSVRKTPMKGKWLSGEESNVGVGGFSQRFEKKIIFIHVSIYFLY